MRYLVMGVSSFTIANVTGSRPLGFTSPNSTSASAWPISWPGYLTSSRQSTERSEILGAQNMQAHGYNDDFAVECSQ